MGRGAMLLHSQRGTGLGFIWFKRLGFWGFRVLGLRV